MKTLVLNGDLIFSFEGSEYAVHHGAVYAWRGLQVSNIPRAFISQSSGLKAYGGGRTLSDSEFRVFGEKIELWKQLTS